MNLRIDAQKLRFRISTAELEALCSGSSLTQCTYFPNMRALTIDITPQDIDPALQLIVEGEHMTLAVQKRAAEGLFHALPSREGIEVTQTITPVTITPVQRLELSLEVDIHTQKRARRGPAT